MKIRFVHVGLVVAAALMLAIWMSAKMREARVAKALAEPVPVEATAASAGTTPDAAKRRSRQAFERMAREFLRDAPNMSPEIRMQRAQALAREVESLESGGELQADEAVLIRIGLIQAAVVDDTERARQAQAVVDHYKTQTERRKAAAAAQVQRDARLRQYKAREADIVAEVLAMSSYPGGLSRDEYLRLRLREAHAAIYGTPAQRPSLP
ncbi:MAG: hypothetical protein KF800_17540 [Lysobacter sp.]|nr:hypothetical protein [Lysobacter sp.]